MFKQKETNTNPPAEEKQPDKGERIVRILSENLKEQQKQTKLLEEIKAMMEQKENRTAELRHAEIKEHKNMSNVLKRSLHTQKHGEERCQRDERHELRNYVTIHLFPGGEGDNSAITQQFVERLIKEELGVKEEVHIDEVEQVNGARMEDDNHPRSIRVRFQNYNMKQRVLQAAWTKKEIHMNNYRIYFDEDFDEDMSLPSFLRCHLIHYSLAVVDLRCAVVQAILPGMV